LFEGNLIVFLNAAASSECVPEGHYEVNATEGIFKDMQGDLLRDRTARGSFGH
jgi:hypothetical protein